MTIKPLALILGLFAAPAAAAPRRAPPAGPDLFRAARAASSQPFAAFIRVQSFDRAGKAKAQYWRQSSGPDGLRIEASAKRGGAMALLEVVNDKTRLQAWPQVKRAWLGPAAPPADSVAAALYDLTVSTGGRVAGQTTWRLDMVSKADGRLRGSWWVARKNAFVLRREDYRRDGSLLRRERVIRLEEPAADRAPFAADAPAGVTVTDSRTPYRIAAGGAEGAIAPEYPQWTPAGFVLWEISANRDGAALVYSDGLRQATLVERPVGGARSGAAPYGEVRVESKTIRFFDEADAIRLVWRASARECSLSGDLPEADLARMANSVAASP